MNDNKIKECTNLSDEILKNIESSKMPLGDIILKCLRLCRILNDEAGIKFFTFESEGYPKNKEGKLTREACKIAKIASRYYNEEYYSESISELENSITYHKSKLIEPPPDNNSIKSLGEVAAQLGRRPNHLVVIENHSNLISKIKSHIHKYILNINIKLKYENVIENRNLVDSKLMELCPEAISQFNSSYQNIQSDNPEDWAGAVHSCRRILKTVADKLYPPTDEIRYKKDGKIKINLGEKNVINRLVCYIEDKSESDTYKKVVGNDLSSIGKRIDAIYNSTSKGTHAYVTKDEAQRYIMHVYFLLSDILIL